MMNMPKRQRGFTMLELAVAIAVLALLTTYAMEGLGNVLDYKSRLDTDNKLKAWRKAVESVYLTYTQTIDSNTGAVIDLGGGTVINPVNPSATTKRCNMTAANIAEFAKWAGYSSGDLINDGHHRSFCMLVTARQSSTISGATVYYHSIAIVSPGSNGVIESDTTLDSSGNLNINPAKDDVGILFDGRKFATDRYNLTVAAMKRTVDAYSAYYSARYQSDSSRTLAIDYFSCGASSCPGSVARWDSAGDMPATCSGPISMVQTTGTSPQTVLGLSQPDVTDGWGNVFTMDNCTSAVRSPSNSTASKQSPPYTAAISTTLPGGSVLSMTAVGQI